MKSRELTQIECVAILTASHYGRLGLSCKDQPYVIPMSYAYSDEKLYLHSRGAGKKLDIARNNPKVCFEVDLLDKNRWSSVIAYGMVSISTDVEAKRRMFDAFVLKGLEGHGCRHFRREELGTLNMIIWELEIKLMTGRDGIW